MDMTLIEDVIFDRLILDFMLLMSNTSRGNLNDNTDCYFVRFLQNVIKPSY